MQFLIFVLLSECNCLYTPKKVLLVAIEKQSPKRTNNNIGAIGDETMQPLLFLLKLNLEDVTWVVLTLLTQLLIFTLYVFESNEKVMQL